MEITLSLPARDWYRNTPDNNLTYWGLDYPPLSAYASVVMGRFVSAFDSKALILHESHGHETASSRAAMRFTVLIADVLILFPAFILFLNSIYHRKGSQQNDIFAINNGFQETLAFCLTLPALLLIDHAHFQYNNVSLGLFLTSLSCFIEEWDTLGSALFCAAIYFKHMLLYYVLAVFTLLVTRMFQVFYNHGSLAAFMYSTKILFSIAATTCLTFAPWLGEKQLLAEVFSRLFPISRGLYEGKVANVWCSISVIIRLQRFLKGTQLFGFCAIITLLASIPFCVALAIKPSCTRLILAVFGCSLSAFLFSYQVHEKQILIPLVPLAGLYGKFPKLSSWMSFVSTFSIFHLLFREGSSAAYVASAAIHFVIVMLTMLRRAQTKILDDVTLHRAWVVPGFAAITVIMAMGLNFALIFVEPPSFAPDIVVLLNTSFACAHLGLIYLMSLYYAFNT